MSDREELADLIGGVIVDDGAVRTLLIADAILAAGYRKVVTRPAEIPVLPGQITVDTVLGE